jgi:hypothetical protein
VKFEISSYDVDPDVAYYGFISPADMFDVVGTPSKEICFKINSNVCLQDTSCDSLSSMDSQSDVIEQH